MKDEDKMLQVSTWDNRHIAMMKSLRKYTSALNQTIAKDAVGRPTQLINPFVIMETGFVDNVEKFIDTPPEGCLSAISTLEGLPTIAGMPIWEIIPGEPVEYFELFKRYRSMKDAKTARATFKLALEIGATTQSVELLRQIYSWQDRVQAYDAYIKYERDIQLELRRVEIENRHINTAEKLFNIASKYLLEHEELLSPKVALQMLDLSVKLERSSIGLNPTGRTSNDGPISVNIQNNNGGATQIVAEEPTAGTGNVEKDKEKVKQLVNIMNTLNLFTPTPETSEAIDVEVEEDGN